jgi:parvulin-like peptidyl-prolyl isomerase
MELLALINGVGIDAGEAVRQQLFTGGRLLDDIVDEALLREYAARQGTTNTDRELQVAFDELRYRHGLISVEATEQWLRNTSQTLRSVQNGLDLQILRNKILGGLSDETLRAYHADHSLDFEFVRLYSIRVASESLAGELLAQMREERANFHVLAIEHSTDEETRHLGGWVGARSRSELTPAIADAVFGQPQGAIVGPVQTEHGWNLFKVALHSRPAFDEVKERVRTQVYDQLRQKLRATADVSFPLLDGRRDMASVAQSQGADHV